MYREFSDLFQNEAQIQDLVDAWGRRAVADGMARGKVWVRAERESEGL